jgi:hypothetical protein
MVYLDELAREMREIGRQRRRARAALVALNRAHGGGAAPDPNRTARTGGRTANGRGRYFSAAAWAATPTRGGAGDDDVRFDVDDPRRDRPGWGSRNPLAWIAWIVTRPLALIFWVRYVGDRSAASARLSRFFILAPAEATKASFHFFFPHHQASFFFAHQASFFFPAHPHSPSRTLNVRRAQLLECCCFYRQAMHCATLLTVLFLWGVLTYSVFA